MSLFTGSTAGAGLLKPDLNLPPANRRRRLRAAVAAVVCVLCMSGEMYAATGSPVLGVALVGGIAYLQCVLSWLARIVYGWITITPFRMKMVPVIRQVPMFAGLAATGVVGLTAGTMRAEALMISVIVVPVSMAAGMVRPASTPSPGCTGPPATQVAATSRSRRPASGPTPPATQPVRLAGRPGRAPAPGRRSIRAPTTAPTTHHPQQPPDRRLRPTSARS